jgi:hypothetical protein
MATRIDVEGAKSWSTQPEDEWITVPEAEARLALLEKKAALADRGRFTLGGVARGARLLLREQDEAIAWCADYDALEASR